MKTKNLHITGSSTLMVLFMGLSLTVFGQSRTNYSRGGNASSNSRTVTATRSSNQRTVVTQRQKTNNARTSFRSAESRTTSSGNNSSWNNNKSNNKNWNNSGSKKNSGNWSSNEHKNYGYNNNGYNNHNKNYNKNWKKGYGQNEHGYYSYGHHPRTYNVWKFPAPWRYSPHAVVFRHNHDDFFFYNNVFYRYSPFRGYYAVSCPAGIVFSYLPVGYNEVMVNGRIYYRYGNVFFEPTFEGYRIINPPSGIYVSFNF